MENKATKKFLFISLGLLALVMALTPVLAGPVTEAYWYATYMKAIPLVAIYALPALISLISIPVVSIWHRKWLYRWDKISLIANIAITVCIVLLSAIWLAGALGFDRSELMVSFVPAVLVLVSSLLLGLSVGMLISAVQGIKRSRRDIPAGERTPVTYSQMFAVCWFMASVLFLLFGVVAAFAGSEIVTGEFMMNVLVFGGYFALVVAACAGLFYLIGILWHKSKGVAALLIVITVLLAIATFVIYLFTVNMRNNYLGYSYRDEPQWYDQVHGRYADYTHYGAGNPLPEEESGVVIRSDDMDYDYAEEYGEYYNDEWSEKFGSTVNIAGLWNNRGEVGDSVSAALAYAVDNIHLSHMSDDAPWQMMPWLDWYAASYYEEIRTGG